MHISDDALTGQEVSRQLGTVSSLIYSRGFGFILTSDRTPIFFHFRQCERVPSPGDIVSYVPGRDSHGRTVANSVRIEKGDA
jgi:cold shock CspA family protein